MFYIYIPYNMEEVDISSIEVEDKKTVVYFLTRIDNERIKTINEEVKRKSEAERRRAKARK